MLKEAVLDKYISGVVRMTVVRMITELMQKMDFFS